MKIMIGLSIYFKTIQKQIEFLSEYHPEQLKTIIDFIPMSDSIFITGGINNNFLKTISLILLNSYLFSIADVSGRKDDPRFVEIPHIKLDENNEVTREIKLIKRFPLLFRGGVSSSEFECKQHPIIVNNDRILSNYTVPL